jgi:hypothetical protein
MRGVTCAGDMGGVLIIGGVSQCRTPLIVELRARDASQRPATFQNGHRKFGGRKKGTPNVVTKDLKIATIEAATRIGSDGNGKDGLVHQNVRRSSARAATPPTSRRAQCHDQISLGGRTSREAYRAGSSSGDASRAGTKVCRRGCGPGGGRGGPSGVHEESGPAREN